VRVDRPRPVDRHRGRDGRGLAQKRRHHSDHGTSTKGENGFSEQIKTVTLNVKAKFAPAEKENNKAPNYGNLAGQCIDSAPLGTRLRTRAAHTSRSSFPAPIFASLVVVEGGDGYVLIWSRRDPALRQH
jgi:uncharacterized protein (DUF736 family)